MTVPFSKSLTFEAKTSGRFKKSWDIPFLVPSEKGEKSASFVVAIFLWLKVG